MNPTWILGDPHVGHDRAADDALLALLRDAADQQVDLVVMGDLFVAWIARDRFLTDDQRRVVDALRAVRQAGGRVRFVVGNRDYLAGGLAGDAFDVVYEGEAVADVGGVPTMLLHGDGLNPEDRPYRAWRALSRSRIATALLERLPGRVGRGLARRTERGLRDVNTKYKTGPLPRAALEAVAARAAKAGARRVLVGHFHDDATIEAHGVELRIVPGWFEHRFVLVASADGIVRGDPR
jgi:UDP-2,3-diacylglucosamine hydrolase